MLYDSVDTCRSYPKLYKYPNISPQNVETLSTFQFNSGADSAGMVTFQIFCLVGKIKDI